MSSAEELGLSLQRFGWPDYLVFGAMLAMCALIGVYFGFCGGSKSGTALEYLMGGRSMKTFPVAMSLIASFISGISLLGVPTEIYVYGIQYWYTLIAALVSGICTTYAILPVFHQLQFTSIYEYLERRFSKKVRLLGSFLSVVSFVTYLPIVIYVPALAFNQVTGVNIHIISPVICTVCIFYTCVGGLKAVVWTDVIQTFIMVGAMILIIVKGTYDVGGVQTVWKRNFEGGRLETPNLSLDIYERHTFIALVFGGFAGWVQLISFSQSLVQRYLSLRTLKSAQTALWIFIFGCITLISICCYTGLMIYATYYDCDPLTTKLARAKDQLLPLFVMESLGRFPGVPGLFVAGVVSAALSSLSTGLNATAAIIFEDFYKMFFKKPLTDRQTSILLKSVVVLMGVVSVALVVVIEKLGTVQQFSRSLSGITDGAMLGIFAMGLFMPCVNSKGALVGGVAGLGFISWVIFGAQADIATGRITFPTKPTSVAGCTYNYTAPFTTHNSTFVANTDAFGLYRVSYLWYTLMGAAVTVCVGVIFSVISGGTNSEKLDPLLLSPAIRGWFQKTPRRQLDTPDCQYEFSNTDNL